MVYYCPIRTIGREGHVPRQKFFSVQRESKNGFRMIGTQAGKRVFARFICKRRERNVKEPTRVRKAQKEIRDTKAKKKYGAGKRALS